MQSTPEDAPPSDVHETPIKDMCKLNGEKSRGTEKAPKKVRLGGVLSWIFFLRGKRAIDRFRVTCMHKDGISLLLCPVTKTFTVQLVTIPVLYATPAIPTVCPSAHNILVAASPLPFGVFSVILLWSFASPTRTLIRKSSARTLRFPFGLARSTRRISWERPWHLGVWTILCVDIFSGLQRVLE